MNWEINCDLGEGIEHEEQIFPWIDAASIACGGHYGDLNTIQSSLLLAKKFGVKAGIHPSYPDRENFGRKSMDLPFSQLADSLRNQVELFLEVAYSLQIRPDHLKFHGALYNDAAKYPDLSNQLIEMLKSHYPKMTLFVPPFSCMEKAAREAKMKIKLEIFGDRTYQDNFQLLERNQSKALLTQVQEVESQISGIILKNELISSSGHPLTIQADTICLHGDNPGILKFLPAIRRKFWANPN